MLNDISLRPARLASASGPDFLCVGMFKAGTQWLYDQLQSHPDFWMPPLKEMHYLNRDGDIGRNARKILEGARSTSRPGSTRRSGIADPRDRDFLEEMAGHCGAPLDLGKYGALFRHKGGLLSGDITPPYGELDETVVAQVARCFPDAKILLLLRDPITRAWSHISQWHRRGEFNARTLLSPERFRAFLEHSAKLQKFSSATRVAERWQAHVGEGRFRYFFLEDIAQRPQEARHDILIALGADPQKESALIDPGYNRKSEHRKLELTADLEAVLVDFLEEELRSCAAMFGGHAGTWVAKYGL